MFEEGVFVFFNVGVKEFGDELLNVLVGCPAGFAFFLLEEQVVESR